MTQPGPETGATPERACEVSIVRLQEGERRAEQTAVICEEPLEIRIDDHPYVVVMRTPGDEVALAAGLLLAEGVIRSRADLATIEFCGSQGGNSVRVSLTAAGQEHAAPALGRKAYLSRTGCGLCGKELIAEISWRFREITRRVRIAPDALLRLLGELSRRQELRVLSRGSHGVATFDEAGQLLSFAEDVGRHNAMDKAIGALLMRGRLEEIAVCVTSSRASFEMAQKAAAAGIPILAAVSAPTSLAIEVARRAGMTLVCRLRGGGFEIYTGEERVVE